MSSPVANQTASESRRLLSGFLLLPQPPVSFAYLLGVRSGLIQPSLLPLIVLALFPLAAGIIAVSCARNPTSSAAGATWVLLFLSVIEILWAALTLIIVNLAMVWRC